MEKDNHMGLDQHEGDTIVSEFPFLGELSL